MSTRIFVTGMLRSGTSLLQTLLTNHPRLLVAYQPFHQLHVDVKQLYLDEHGLERVLPLDDGSPGRMFERASFTTWLASRVFDDSRAQWLADRAATGKGGGVPELAGAFKADAGTFFDIAESLHASLAQALGRASPSLLVGSKEVLCEEYVPASLRAGVRCVLIARDPRAVIASANHGRYRDMVGDRYPLLMLIRMWRKSVECWLQHQHHPLVHVVRYEDLITSPAVHLDRIASWLGLGNYPTSTLRAPLHDHAGKPWQGNSSFGDKPTIDALAGNTWEGVLDNAEVDLIEACTQTHMAALGYHMQGRGDREAIETFVEDLAGVRPAYLDLHRLDATNRELELGLWEASDATDARAAAREMP